MAVNMIIIKSYMKCLSYIEFLIWVVIWYEIYETSLRDDFNFPIVNFPFLNSNIPSAPANDDYVSQLIRYATNYQGPVVQSVVSLTSSLRVILLTVLADSIYNILIFCAEKCE